VISLLLAAAVYLQTPVVRVCYVTSGEDLVVRRTELKSEAGMCVTQVPCKDAELWLRAASEASIIVFESKDHNQCR